MLRILTATLVAGLIIFSVIAPQAQAQHIYLRMYWVLGDVADPDGVGTEGRWVVFYRDDPANAYSDDLVGIVGLAGRANQYMLNGFEDWRMVIEPGIYKCATVKGYKNGVLVDDYGANPKEVLITGLGYDICPTLTLVRGGGIAPPGPRPNPAWLAALLPKIENIKFGDRKWNPAFGEDFVIDEQPIVSAKITSQSPLRTESIMMILNAGMADSKNFSVSSSHYTAIKGSQQAPTEVNFSYDFFKEGQKLPAGQQKLTFTGANDYGSTEEVCSVKIMAGEVEVIGIPIAYPSPVHLRTDRLVTLQYGLTKNADIDLYVFDITARIIKKISCDRGTSGGQAGGTVNPNKVTWDLITDQGSLAGSGIYLYNIVDRNRNRVLSKGKITLVP